MAAPAIVGARSGSTFSSSASWAVTITGGFTAGNSVIFIVTQSTTGTIRTVTSVVASNGDVFTLEPGAFNDNAAGGPMVAIYRCLASVGMAASGSITINWNANATGLFHIHEFTPVTSASLGNSVAEASSTSHTSTAAGLTTAGDVLLVSVGQASGNVTPTAGTGYTLRGTSASAIWQTLAQTSGVTSNTGPWTSTVARINIGAMAAFYSVATPAAWLPNRYRRASEGQQARLRR